MPKGIEDVTTANARNFAGHFSSFAINIAIKTNAKNNPPWIVPTRVTIAGSPIRYFMGIATKNKTKSEMPSMKLNTLNALINRSPFT